MQAWLLDCGALADSRAGTNACAAHEARDRVACSAVAGSSRTLDAAPDSHGTEGVYSRDMGRGSSREGGGTLDAAPDSHGYSLMALRKPLT